MINRVVKKIIPPILWSLVSMMKQDQIKFIFGYDSWRDCKKNATGYDDDAIIEKVRVATHEVLSKNAKYERDSVLFYDNSQIWHLISLLALKKVENLEHDLSCLSIVDYGGALGSLYFQHLELIERIGGIEWNIVEQRKFVEIGKREFQNRTLKFHENIDTITRCDIVILSSVLQYLETPYSVLESLLALSPHYVIVDRLFINDREDHDLLSLQKNPRSIVNSSYPCWVMSKEKFCKYISLRGYRLLSDMKGADSFRNGMQSHCFILQKDKEND